MGFRLFTHYKAYQDKLFNANQNLLIYVIQDLKIDIVNLDVNIQSNTISIVFHFPNDTLNMEVKL